MSIEVLLVVLFVGVLAAAAVVDVASFTIPNALVLAVVILFIAALLLIPNVGIAFSGAAAAAIIFSIGLVLFRLDMMGGGDVKLWAAAAMWAGLEGVLLQALAVAYVGGVYALLVLSARGCIRIARFSGLFTHSQLPRVLQPSGPVPFGVAIAIGTVVALPSMPLVAQLVSV